MSTGTQTSQSQATKSSRVLHTGKVISIAYSPELINNIGKQTHTEAEITSWGVPGDRHYGETRVSHGQVVPNNRPITVCGVEAARAACERLGVPDIPAGGLGENLLLEGAGDLGDLEEGDQIQVLDSAGEPKVTLEVRKQNEPCSNLMIYHKQMTKEMFGIRGVICTVLKEGNARVGDTVKIIR